MGYYEFVITVGSDSTDAIISCLSDLDCLGFHERGGKLVAYFLDNRDVNMIKGRLNSLKPMLREAGLDDRLYFDYSYLSERDWNEPWKKRFIPIDIGERFRIIPPWEQKVPDRLNVVIDPGMAFGTGHHETTRDCLLLIERYSSMVQREAFLDIGTGTGILAIGASMIGFKKILGIDIDPLAIEASRRNVKLNNLGNVRVEKTILRDINGSFDMISANLMSEVLIAIACEISRLMIGQGVAILSGMLEGQEGDVIREMERFSLVKVESLYNNRWVSLVMRKELTDPVPSHT